MQEQDIRPDTNGVEWVTTRVAAEVLGVNPRRIREYISEGTLEARAEGQGTNKRYLVSRSSIQTMETELRAKGEQTHEIPDNLTEKSAELLLDLATQLSEARYRLGHAEARLEMAITSRAELQAQLEQERERVSHLEAERDRLVPDLLRERDRVTAERTRAEHFEAELRRALEARRGWFRRFFGF